MFPIPLDRPLCVFDIEATGTSPRADRIIELAVIRIGPDGTETLRDWLVNPGMPIPLESTAVHGITDEIVRGCPTFAEIAVEVREFFGAGDLGEFNVIRYDLPMLVEEFARAGVAFDADSRRILDAQRIFHMREPRDLTAALAFYCGRPHTDAHGATADTQATLEVLRGQFSRYADLPREMEALDRLLNPRDPFHADRTGRLRWVDGEITINFGKKKGARLRDLARDEPDFLRWIVRSDFPADTRRIVEQAMQNIYPEPPRLRPQPSA